MAAPDPAVALALSPGKMLQLLRLWFGIPGLLDLIISHHGWGLERFILTVFIPPSSLAVETLRSH